MRIVEELSQYANALIPKMTRRYFESGYRYSDQLKTFASASVSQPQGR